MVYQGATVEYNGQRWKVQWVDSNTAGIERWAGFVGHVFQAVEINKLKVVFQQNITNAQKQPEQL